MYPKEASEKDPLIKDFNTRTPSDISILKFAQPPPQFAPKLSHSDNNNHTKRLSHLGVPEQDQ